jgi:uncharacterized radical SAM superfamily Fe-S cluster-containing enzyme
MKYSEVLDTFTRVSDMQEIFNKKQYDVFAVTGGEPTLDLERLQGIIYEIKVNTNARVHLWTNGIKLESHYVQANRDVIDGINISVHDGGWNYLKWWQLRQIIPIRLHIWEELSNDRLRRFCKQHNIYLNEWEMDKCDINEDRYILEER